MEMILKVCYKIVRGGKPTSLNHMLRKMYNMRIVLEGKVCLYQFVESHTKKTIALLESDIAMQRERKKSITMKPCHYTLK